MTVEYMRGYSFPRLTVMPSARHVGASIPKGNSGFEPTVAKE